jgi:DNA-binding response OmpR family regulator
MAKILVIEDEDVLLDTLSELLRYEKFEIIGASSGEAGIKLAVSEQPDLVVCDIILNGIDGFEVLKALRGDLATAKIPVIFLTGQVSPKEMQAGEGLGVDDYLCKPATRMGIVAAIRKQLSKHATSDSQPPV